MYLSMCAGGGVLIIPTKQQMHLRGVWETEGMFAQERMRLTTDSIYAGLMGVSRDVWVGRVYWLTRLISLPSPPTVITAAPQVHLC